MAFPNVSDIVATTIESRTKTIRDNVTKNNALLKMLQKKGKNKSFSGGSIIYEEISFAANGNAGFYSGYDILPVAAQDVISAAQFNIKQAACPVIISGLEMLQNSGKEAFIDLLESRIQVAEASMANLISQGLYSDGSGYGGKTITGLDAAVETTAEASQTSTYGGISRGTWSFWRNKVQSDSGAPAYNTIQGRMNSLWAQLVRGSDRPNLIISGNTYWATFMASLQAIQRFTDASTADLGFPSVDYMGTPVVLDGGIGGYATDTLGTMYFLNTDYLRFRTHGDRDFVTLNPGKRYAVNQDAEVSVLAWAGNLTCAGSQFQGRLIHS